MVKNKDEDHEFRDLALTWSFFAKQQWEKAMFGGGDDYDEIMDENRQVSKDIIAAIKKALDEDVRDDLDSYTNRTAKASRYFDIRNWKDFAFFPGVPSFFVNPTKVKWGRRGKVVETIADFKSDLNEEINEAEDKDEEVSEQRLEELLNDLKENLREQVCKKKAGKKQAQK